MNDFNELLMTVINMAADLKIPISDRIDPNVKINHRAVGRFGLCKKIGNGYEIELTYRLIDASRTACINVLAHEVLHTCPGCMNHQKKWKKYAYMMNEKYSLNITNTDTCAALGVEDIARIKYVITCDKCGAVIKRQKASKLVSHPERYRCRCGGKFIVSKFNNM